MRVGPITLPGAAAIILWWQAAAPRTAMTNRLADRFPQTGSIGTVFGQALSEHSNQLAVCL